MPSAACPISREAEGGKFPAAGNFFDSAPGCTGFSYSGQRFRGNFPTREAGNSADRSRERPTPSRELQGTHRRAFLRPIETASCHAIAAILGAFDSILLY